MTTLEKIVATLEDYDLDGASGFYTVELQKAARAVIEALKDPEPAVIREGEEVYCAATRDRTASGNRERGMTTIEKIIRRIVSERTYPENQIENIVSGKAAVTASLPHVVRTVVEALKDSHVVRPHYIRDVTYDAIVNEDAKGAWNAILESILKET